MGSTSKSNKIKQQKKNTQAGKKQENNIDVPDTVKASIANLSGCSMDDVKVHHNPDNPVQSQAHTYAQGSDIHIKPRQEKHLPYEAWLIVKEKQGRVKSTK